MASQLEVSELDRKLDEDDQGPVEEALQFVQSRWRGIGSQLNLRDSTLSNFEKLDNAGATGKMVASYLAGNYNTERFGFPTWKKIIEAVEKPAGGDNHAEARKIAAKYCGMSSSTTEESTKQAGSSTKSQNAGTTKVPEFNVKKLRLFKWTDTDGKSKNFELINEISSKWHDIGVMLDQSSRLDGIKMKYLADANLCCEDVLQEWINNVGTSDYTASWKGMLSLLEDIKLRAIANSLRKALDSF